MDVSDIISLIRDQTHTTDDEFDNDRILKYLNIVKDDFFSTIIVWVNEDYNWDYFKTDTIANQDEYILPDIEVNTIGTKKIKGISINYNGKTYDNGRDKYIKSKEVDLATLDRDWNHYVQNQSEEFPIYFIADNSFFIAPAPKKDRSNAIILRGIREISDYEYATLWPDLWFPSEYHHILVQWCLPYIYKAQGRNSEVIFEQQEYIRKREQSVFELADRNQSSTYLDYPLDRERNSEDPRINVYYN